MSHRSLSHRSLFHRSLSHRSLFNRCWYWLWHRLCRLIAVMLFQVRCFGRGRVPDQGSVLIVSNHQSHLDPMLVGLACNRRMNFLARDTLFRNRLLGRLMSSLDAIPIDRSGAGTAGLKETLRRLKCQEMVLLFPEGTRSADGEVGPLRPGFCVLARRTGAVLLPVAVDGAYQVWPRTQWLPRPGRVVVQFGTVISAEQIAASDDATLMRRVEEQIGDCRRSARRRRVGQPAVGRARPCDDGQEQL